MNEQNADNERSFDLARLWWVPLVGIPLVVVLTLALRGFVHDVLALPVSHFLWFAELAFKSIPQSVCWSALLIMVVVIALKSLGGRRSAPSPKLKLSPPRPGRVRMWAERIELLFKGKYSRHRFGYYLGRLILDVLAYEERLSYRDIGSRIEQKEFVLPLVVEEYAMARLKPGLVPSPGLLARLKHVLGLEQSLPASRTRELERVLQFLEDREAGE